MQPNVTGRERRGIMPASTGRQLGVDEIHYLGYRYAQIPPVASAAGREAADEAASAFS